MNTSASLSTLSAIDAQCHEWAETAFGVASAYNWARDYGYPNHAAVWNVSELADRIIAARTAQAQQAAGGAL